MFTSELTDFRYTAFNVPITLCIGICLFKKYHEYFKTTDGHVYLVLLLLLELILSCSLVQDFDYNRN